MRIAVLAGDYLLLKLAHILIAVIALGTGAALAILLELYGNHPEHGAFVLRAVRRLVYLIVIPGYVLMLGTGMWLGGAASLLDEYWTEAAMNLWGVGALLLAASVVLLHKRIRLLNAGPASRAYRQASLLGRLSGGGAALVIVTIIYFMVMKPSR